VAEEGLAVRVAEREEIRKKKSEKEAENGVKLNEVANEKEHLQSKLALFETLQKQIVGLAFLSFPHEPHRLIFSSTLCRKSLQELLEDEEKLSKKKQEAEANIEAINEKIKQGNDNLLEIREALATSDIFKRNISDNIRHIDIVFCVFFFLIVYCSNCRDTDIESKKQSLQSWKRTSNKRKRKLLGWEVLNRPISISNDCPTPPNKRNGRHTIYTSSGSKRPATKTTSVSSM